jgi:hypothetical protein
MRYHKKLMGKLLIRLSYVLKAEILKEIMFFKATTSASS